MSESSWQKHELEYLGCCPVCSSSIRVLEHGGIEDRVSGIPGFWDYYRCDECGVLYLDPRPTQESVGRLYENYFTHSAIEERERANWLDKFALGIRNDYLNWKYGYQYHPQQSGGSWLMYLLPPWLRHEWDHVARHLPKPLPGKKRLLDVGCGNGDFLRAACSAGWDGFGIDFDQKALEIASKCGVKTQLGSLEAQQFDSCTFDVITLSNVIEHVHNPIQLLAECARVLKHGGAFWLTTPNTDSIIRQFFGHNWLYFIPDHLVLFSVAQLRNILESMGFYAIIERRGVHVQSHWRASLAIQQGKFGVQSIYLSSFVGRKNQLRFWPLEFFTFLTPSRQGDVVIRAIKH